MPIVARHLASRRIGVHVPGVVVGHQDGVEGVVEHGPESGFAFPQHLHGLAVIGDVVERGDGAVDVAFGGKERRGVDRQDDLAAVAPPDGENLVFDRLSGRHGPAQGQLVCVQSTTGKVRQLPLRRIKGAFGHFFRIESENASRPLVGKGDPPAPIDSRDAHGAGQGHLTDQLPLAQKPVLSLNLPGHVLIEGDDVARRQFIHDAVPPSFDALVGVDRRRIPLGAAGPPDPLEHVHEAELPDPGENRRDPPADDLFPVDPVDPLPGGVVIDEFEVFAVVHGPEDGRAVEQVPEQGLVPGPALPQGRFAFGPPGQKRGRQQGGDPQDPQARRQGRVAARLGESEPQERCQEKNDGDGENFRDPPAGAGHRRYPFIGFTFRIFSHISVDTAPPVPNSSAR